jgi:signal transduction histidine kinase/ligand-binding sensor domain-containing protein
MSAFLAIGVSGSALKSQDTHIVLDRYQLDVWRAQDGVRLSFTSNLVQTHDGYLWLSTQSGLTRFDGLHFKTFDGTNTPALRGRPNLQTYPLLEDAHHTLWIGSDAGLLTNDGRAFTSLARDSTFATDLVNAAVLDSAGRVLMITRLGRLLHVSRAAGVQMVSRPSVGSLGSSMTVDVHGDVWIAAGAQGAFRVHHDSIAAAVFPRRAQLQEVNRIIATSDSALWLGTATGIVHLKDGVARRIPLPAREALAAVSCLAMGPDGALWIGTEGAGLFRFDGSVLSRLSRRDGLSDDRVIDVIVDHDGNVWVATRDGLNRLKSVAFESYTLTTGLPTALPGAILRDKRGAVWLAPPTGGLFFGSMSSGRATFAAAETVSRSDRITALALGRGGSVWAGRLRGTVTRFVGGHATPSPTIGALPPVTDILEEPNGTLWIGTWHGLFQMNAGVLRARTAKDGLPDDAVHRVLRDSSGTLWVATQSGVARARPGEDRFSPVVPDGGGIRAAVLFEAPVGTIWVGSASGLARISGGRPAVITTAQGLPENWVGAAERDSIGGLYLGQLGGLTRVELRDLIAVADGRVPALTTVASYSSLDGLPGGDPTAWPHPWSFTDGRGMLWFAMAHGVVMVDPARRPRAARAPLVTIEQLLIDGASVPLTGSPTIGAEAQRVELQYTGVDLTNGPGVRFRYRLDGFDTTWVDAGSQRIASYTRLGAGSYRFRVAARAGNGGWSPAESTTEFRVLAPAWRRPWFIALTALAAALLLWSAHHARLRTRSAAIRAERTRMAREIHDSLLQGFGGIALQLHAASTRLALRPEQQPLVDRVLALIDRTLTQARSTVWEMRLDDTGMTDLSVDCAAAAERILADSETAVRVVQHGRTRRLSPARRAACLRITEEALTNVRKHAGASEVVVGFDYNWRRLRLSITDNGKGDDLSLQSQRPGHWGLVGMRERAHQVGGRLFLDSEAGKGTTVAVESGYARGIFTWPEPRDTQD